MGVLARGPEAVRSLSEAGMAGGALPRAGKLSGVGLALVRSGLTRRCEQAGFNPEAPIEEREAALKAF